MDILTTLVDSGALKFFVICAAVGFVLGLAFLFARIALESILDFIFSFSIIRYGFLACLVVIAVKFIVWP